MLWKSLCATAPNSSPYVQRAENELQLQYVYLFACWKLEVLSMKNHLENFVCQHSNNEDLCSILSILICISSKIFVALLVDCLSPPPQHSAFRSPSFVHKDLLSTKRIISQLRVNKYRSKPKKLFLVSWWQCSMRTTLIKFQISTYTRTELFNWKMISVSESRGFSQVKIRSGTFFCELFSTLSELQPLCLSAIFFFSQNHLMINPIAVLPFDQHSCDFSHTWMNEKNVN